MPPHQGGIERVAEALFAAYQREALAVRWVASRVPADAPPREGARIRVPCLNTFERRLGVPVPVWGPAAWRAVRELAEWADVLHVHDCIYPGSAMAVVLAGRRGKPVLLSQHVGFVRYSRAILNTLERLAYATLGRAVLRRARYLVFATPAAEQHVRALLGGAPPRSCSIPNGIDTERFRPGAPDERRAARARLGLPPDGRVVLFAGRLVEKKGLPIVLEVSRRMPAVRFLVVGDGPLAPLLREAPENVAWRREVGPDQMPACYHAADCLLLPSHGEGLPLVVQEAMACGVPAVISQGEPFARALVDDGVSVAAPPAADAVAARVAEVLAGSTASFAALARPYALARWSARTMAASYIRVLTGLVAPAGGV